MLITGVFLFKAIKYDSHFFTVNRENIYLFMLTVEISFNINKNGIFMVNVYFIPSAAILYLMSIALIVCKIVKEIM